MSDQHLRLGESYLHYRRRVLDTKSASFCGAKWYYATIWLNSGMTTACHHPLPHHVPVEQVLSNPKALSNTARKKQERREMQLGTRCQGCDYCWRVEDLGPDHVSDRVYKSVLYSDDDLDRAMNSDPDSDFDLKYLEISFDRTCNLACNYCNPAFSTSWARDIKTNGPYADLGSDGQNHFGHDHKASGLYDDSDNPYVAAFFRWWESDLHRTLTHLRLTGGEPLMSPHTWRLLDWLDTNNSRPDLYFAINSNLSAKPDLLDRLIDKTKSFGNFHVYTSGETCGTRAEYARDGLEWLAWEHNVKRMLEQSSARSLHSMCTINAITVTGLAEYLDWCVLIKKQYGSDRFYFTLNILRFPNFQSVLVLPTDIRNQTADTLETWLDTNRSAISAMEIEHVQRLIGYLGDGNKAPENLLSLEKDFRSFYSQYDRRRGKDFCRTFPNLAEWYADL